MEKTLHGAFLVIMAFTLLSVQAVGQPTEAQRHAALLNRLERLFLDSDNPQPWFPDTTIQSDTDEYKAVKNEGIPMLPELARRLAYAKEYFRFHSLYSLFEEISHFEDYVYSSTPTDNFGVNYYETNPDRLPFLAFDLEMCEKRVDEKREQLLAWWARIQGFNAFTEHTARMRRITAGLTPDAKNLSGPVYREYCREFCNYGIFNLPSFITLIKQDDNPLAFFEFLCIADPPNYCTIRPLGDHLENVKRVARRCPTHEERLARITVWWAENASQFATLPALQKAIADAVEKEPK